MTTPAKPRPAEEPRTCPTCQGFGWTYSTDTKRERVVCLDCDGYGEVQNLHGTDMPADEGMVSDE